MVPCTEVYSQCAAAVQCAVCSVPVGLEQGWEAQMATTASHSCATTHTSHLTTHTSHLTPYTSHLTPHTSHLTPHIRTVWS